MVVVVVGGGAHSLKGKQMGLHKRAGDQELADGQDHCPGREAPAEQESPATRRYFAGWPRSHDEANSHLITQSTYILLLKAYFNIHWHFMSTDNNLPYDFNQHLKRASVSSEELTKAALVTSDSRLDLCECRFMPAVTKVFCQSSVNIALQ